jgi:transmembrane sensor
MIWHRIRALARSTFGARPSSDIRVDADEGCLDEHDHQDASDAMRDGMPWEVLVRYGAGEATADELALLARWREERTEHALLLRQVSRLATLSREADALRHTDEGWERLQHRMNVEPVVKDGDARVLPVRRVRFDAALPVRRGWAMRAAATTGIAAAAIAAIGISAWYLRPSPPPTLAHIATLRGERREFGLPDGSHVVLGAESDLAFDPERFTSNRALYLVGQGYFAVAHDTRHPFIVHSRGAAVQAVGTEFGVRAYPDDSTIDVAVANGRVVMRADSSAKLGEAVLDVGDLGQLDSAGRVTVRHGENLELYLGWVRGRLIYDMAPASTVVRDLERWYDLSILVDSAAESAGLRVSMTLDPAQPAPVSLQRFAEVMNLRVVTFGNTVELVRRASPARTGTRAHVP